MNRLAALFGCLAVAFALFYATDATPPPQPASAPPTAFSAGRAMLDIAALAPVPHPIGSPANHRVRDLLVGRMAALGLNPQVRPGVGVGVWSDRREPVLAAGEVEDVVGVLPGRDPSLPALALMAHYDSVPGSRGAADDITGVASALETVRAIKAEGVPARDVMLVITDGEEAGLLGAFAFYRDDPLARHVGFVLNMEARGGGGRVAMFETGDHDGGAIDLYRRVARAPNADSLTTFVYRLMPNDTDFSVTKAHGLPGLNYAFIGRQFDYHSPSSTVAALDQGSVQHMGEQVWPVARAIAFSRVLPAKTPDLAFSDLFGIWLVAYPAWAGWIVLALAVGLILVGVTSARRAGALGWGGIAAGAGAGLGLLVGGGILLALARLATGVPGGWMGYRPLLARFPVFELGMGLSALAALLLVAWIVARGGARLAGAWIGLVLTGLAVAVISQALAPTTGPVFAWPLLVAAVALALTGAGTSERRWAWALAAAVMTLSLAWLIGLFHQLLEGLDLPEAPALPLWLAAQAVWPLAWPAEPRKTASLAPAFGALIAGFAIMAFLHVTSPWSPRHPRAVQPLYLVDAASGQAWRVNDGDADAWTRGVLTADGGSIAKRQFPTFAAPVEAAPALAVPLAAPRFAISRTSDGGAVLTYAPTPGADHLRLELSSSAALTAVSFDGRPAHILAQPGQVTHLSWSSPHGFTLAFRPSGPGALSIAYAEAIPTWPASARPLPPTPGIDMLWDRAGTSLVVGRQSLSW